MFSDNQKISLRQTFRLFTFDFIGISTLILPPVLAEHMGIYGVYGILLGGVFGFFYLSYLGWCLKRMHTDLGTFLPGKGGAAGGAARFLSAYLALSCILTAADTAMVFSKLVRLSLVREESFILILVLMLAVAAYAVSGGVESRARVYEVIFWIVLIPLFLMLAFSLNGLDVAYYRPQPDFSVKELFVCGYKVFTAFGSMFFALFFPKYLDEGTPTKRLVSCVRCALVCAVGILFVMYLILVGTFGQKSLAAMEFPAVTLMSSIQLPGGFVKRLDAVMMGVWFFTLFALLNLNLHYGHRLLKKAVARAGQKRYLAISTVFIFALAVLFYYEERLRTLCCYFFLYIGIPVYILLPGLLALFGRKHENTKKQKER